MNTMNSFTHIRALVAAAAFAASSAMPLFGDALWWIVDDLEDVSVSVEGYAEPWSATDVGGISDMRVRLTDPEDTYLNFYWNDGSGYVTDPAATTVQINPSGGGWMALGEYASAAYSFVIELGNWSGGEWTVRAESQLAYSSLDGHISATPLDNPGYTPFNISAQNFSAVPEPSSGILTLLGTILLALRRRRETE